MRERAYRAELDQLDLVTFQLPRISQLPSILGVIAFGSSLRRGQCMFAPGCAQKEKAGCRTAPPTGRREIVIDNRLRRVLTVFTRTHPSVRKIRMLRRAFYMGIQLLSFVKRDGDDIIAWIDNCLRRSEGMSFVPVRLCGSEGPTDG